MARYSQSKTIKGSQKWLQILVNETPELINERLRAKIGLPRDTDIRWLSPLKDDDYAEYSDSHFLKRLGISSQKVMLKEFWPKRGPVWDGLAVAGKARITVEAKSHIPEILSGATGAGAESQALIKRSLQETKTYLDSESRSDWSSIFYQYTNRLAHLYFLRKLNGIYAHLVFVYFINDTEMKGPKSQAEWKGAIKLLHSYLGIGQHKLSRYVHDIFIDVNDLRR